MASTSKLDLASLLVNRRPQPFRLRDGRVTKIALAPDLPFGLGEHQYRVQSLPLATGDRLIFLTDGLLERNASNLPVEELITEGARLPPRGAVQHLINAVLDGTEGKLKDDPAVLCLDWHGGPPRLRSSTSGADN